MQKLQEAALLAAQYINTTNRHIFLTGKAGTGKTTFLKYIIQHTYKNTVVAAPTGIAAINAGGVTLHSLLQLPFGTFIPENVPFSETYERANTPASLFKGRQFNAHKRKLIQELELLIIDEVSMLRADLLDCIDHTLRFLRRRKNEPFGGLQILFIGDLLQLPPVVKDTDWELLKPYYKSPYFFEARALANDQPVLVELQKIYRQSDQDFIDLLNRLRHNKQTAADIEKLNQHYNPNIEELDGHGFIHLTTHNQRADNINATQLQAIEKPKYTYSSHTEGNFPENMIPTAENLVLKEGAQVMFIKNDPSGEGKFFNGKLATVSSLNKHEINVKFEDETEIAVDTYKWENKRYSMDKTTKEIEEVYLGSFEQYPLKLAWAVSIHNSQGLTFEKAILDLSETFAAGQLYVALSRLTSLKGMVLSSKLPEQAPDISTSLKSFTASFPSTVELSKKLDEEKLSFLKNAAFRTYNFDPCYREFDYHLRSFNKAENRSIKQQYQTWTQELVDGLKDLPKTGKQFTKQVHQLVEANDVAKLFERVEKATSYFSEILNAALEKLEAQQKKVKRDKQVKAYRQELQKLYDSLETQLRLCLKYELQVKSAHTGEEINKHDLKQAGLIKDKAEKTAKKDKTPTAEISYNLYKEGKSIKEIAETRGLVTSTIEGHLTKYIETGEIEIDELISPETRKRITAEIEKGNFEGTSELKATLGEEISYGQIRMVQAFLRREDEKTK